jgi:hypothetical protein
MGRGEPVARNRAHRVQDRRVGHTARFDLPLDHPVAEVLVLVGGVGR